MLRRASSLHHQLLACTLPSSLSSISKATTSTNSSVRSTTHQSSTTTFVSITASSSSSTSLRHYSEYQFQRLEEKSWQKQQNIKENYGEEGLKPALPHSDSDLIPAVHAALFRLCTTPHPTLTSESTKPSNPHWINIGLITRQLPDDLLETELEKFSNGGIREVIGKYLSDKDRGVELKFDPEKKIWVARTQPVDDDLAKLTGFINSILTEVRESNDPMYINSLSEVLRGKYLNRHLPRGPRTDNFFTPLKSAEIRAVFSRTMSTYRKSVTRVMWKCFLRVPTCRFDVGKRLHATSGGSLDVIIVRDEYLRRIVNQNLPVDSNSFSYHHQQQQQQQNNQNNDKQEDHQQQRTDSSNSSSPSSSPSAVSSHAAHTHHQEHYIPQALTNRLQVDQLKEVVPTFFIPLETLMEYLRPLGYTEEHVSSFFSLSNNLQLVTLPINNKSYVRMYGGLGEYNTWQSLATNAKYRQYEPVAGKLAKEFIKLLQDGFRFSVESFVRKKYFSHNNNNENDENNPFSLPSSPFQRQQALHEQKSHHDSNSNNNNNSTSAEKFDFVLTPAEVTELKWVSLRKLLEVAGPQLAQKIPVWRGPEALLYFAQLQHIFCFTPGGAPHGGFVCLQPFFYPSKMKINKLPPSSNNKQNTNNSSSSSSNSDFYLVKIPVVPTADNPRAGLVKESDLIASNPAFITPLPISSLEPPESPCTIISTELGKYLKSRKDTLDLSQNKMASMMTITSYFNGVKGGQSSYLRKNAHLSLPELLDPIFDLAQPEYVVPFEEQEDHFLFYEPALASSFTHKMKMIKKKKQEQEQQEERSLSPSSSSLSSTSHSHHHHVPSPFNVQLDTCTSSEHGIDKRPFEEYIKLLSRLLFKKIIWNYDTRALHWTNAAHLLERAKLSMEDQLRYTETSPHFKAPHKLKAVRARAARAQDPDNPFWDTCAFFEQVVLKYIPTDRYCTTAELMHFLLPPEYEKFIPSIGWNIMLHRYGPRVGVVVFNIAKHAHYHHLMQQRGYKTKDELLSSVPATMFYERPYSHKNRNVDHFICILRTDGEYHQNLVKEYEEKNGSSSSSKPNVVQTSRNNILPEGAVALEKSEDEAAVMVADLLFRHGERHYHHAAEGALSSSSSSSQYCLGIAELKEKIPFVKLPSQDSRQYNRKLTDMKILISLLEKHPDKFILLTSGNTVNRVILNSDYIRQKFAERSGSNGGGDTTLRNIMIEDDDGEDDDHDGEEDIEKVDDE